ncbi:hypothetical protein VTJ83DRAFT_1975 [Remersonia thermophila]|uniref:Diphthine--ammonia ligase n=1 Tax=Remersonia thermophila TaxID=72144 RepID=A0ABR4DHE5_9PEZI
MQPNQQEGLNVIALISGGKDSFFSLLHCRANGHRIVALANLHPPGSPSAPRARVARDATRNAPAAAPSGTTPPAAALAGLDEGPGPTAILSGHGGGARGNEQGQAHDQGHEEVRDPARLQHDDDGDDGDDDPNPEPEPEPDLNSFMYQTVGHQVIPLYAEATGIPLYRRAITGRATQGKDYDGHRRRHPPPTPTGSGPSGSRSEPGPAAEAAEEEDDGEDEDKEENEDEDEDDETESMIPLLLAIKKAHPEANALCAGAVLSTYQRTRVESVALRLGLTPLAYLWKFPVLSRAPGGDVPAFAPNDPPGGGAQLLDDMAAAGLEARIVKVASGGLDEAFLWTDVASAAGRARVERAMRRFGAAEDDVGAAVIGEGGEFETLVVDGPPGLFRKRVVVRDEDARVVREGGGSAWLSISRCGLEEKAADENAGEELRVRIPALGDGRFGRIHARWAPGEGDPTESLEQEMPEPSHLPPGTLLRSSEPGPLQQWSFAAREASASIREETLSIVRQIRRRLQERSLPSTAILSATVLLRRMADFPAVNAVYGTLFDAPNPASRVTVACGPALSAAASDASNIAVHLLVHAALPAAQRRGLHVQSRSYWAPANIGPYSQAIAFPIASLAAGPGGARGSMDAAAAAAAGPRLVAVAGQIPLVPASMSLLPVRRREDGAFQMALSLNHLWRIGAETGVQWWTSAVAYFPAAAGGDDDGYRPTMEQNASAAGLVWRLAHTLDDEDEQDEDEDGPDVWDRKFNYRYMTFASGEGKKSGSGSAGAVPDSSVLAAGEPGSGSPASKVVPPMFAAEVEELPRGATVEWHAHFGIANAAENSVVVREGRVAVDASDPSGTGAISSCAREASVWQVVVRSARQEQEQEEEEEEEGETGDGASSAPPPASFVQTVVAQPYEDGHACGGIRRIATFADAVLGQLDGGSAAGGTPKAQTMPMVHVRYVDAGLLGGAGDLGTGPVVPCRSLWNARGERLAAVTVFCGVV